MAEAGYAGPAAGGTSGDLVAGRAAYQRRAWTEARHRLAAADADAGLAPEDRDLLASAAYLTGQGDTAWAAWEWAYRGFAERGEVGRAARCGFWLVLTLAQRGEHARAGGWLARAQGLLDEAGLDCVERGYLRVPVALQALDSGAPAAGYATFREVVETATRFGSSDLLALGRLGCGQALVAQGEVGRGIRVLDEAMLAVTTGEVSPIPAGIIYCAVIIACREIFDLRRAQEWTAALSRWCATQPDLQPYRGQCLVHRSEIMQLRGDWTDAMAEVRRACEHLADPPGDPVLGMALYQQAELLRLRGELARAEETYRRASRSGHPAQPGLALLRLAQGRVGDAAAAIRRLVEETEGVVERARVLAAYVEIALAAGDVEPARTAAEELGTIAASFDTPYLRAVVGYARGSVLLAGGDPGAAGTVLRRSWVIWQELEAPYEAARVRLGIARACRQLGDHDTAEMELDAAGRVFAELGAVPALAQVRKLAAAAAPWAGAGLTAREGEVLRLVASGATNREIADTLVISEKTVARHAANIFTKLGVSTRAAATAYAHRHGLA